MNQVDPTAAVQFSCADHVEEDHALNGFAAQCNRSGVTLVTFCRWNSVVRRLRERSAPHAAEFDYPTDAARAAGAAAEALQDGAPREVHPILLSYDEPRVPRSQESARG